ncbi:AAA family ATPase [Cupriavidus sp. D39]|uniref:AAA family ATPase n=1 Tax=Cupriavidus sp. D39 TaxID=2997877 RepID=UPI00226F45FB|nr:ATP-binding protein [Cupriavidus sp. D39]MCY0854029.1 AAA family ATPase [Cupriavidus sp. D39]
MIPRRRPSRYSRIPLEVPPLVQLWLLRLLVPLGGHQEFIQRSGFSNDTLAKLLGLGEWIDPESEEFNPKTVRAKLRNLHQEAEKQCCNSQISACLNANIARLAELVGLSDTDCQILEFVVMLKNERLLDDTADWLGQLSSAKVFHVLAVLLDLPEPEVREALSTQGVLAQSGLVSVDRSCRSMLNGKLELLSDSFADHIVSSDADPVVLLRDTVALAAPAQLGLADYEHVNSSLAVLQPYLRHALSFGRKGANIFVHGAPGTGKSQLAKALAKDLDCELFEVASEDDDGDPINGERRLRAFRAAQSFFGQRRALILFDEVEDVFNDGDGFFGRKSTAQTRKAWINRMLEANPVPTLWLSNSAECLDAAFIRRFDMIIELPVPPKKQRARIIEGACAGLLDARAVDRVAESEALAPAIVTRAASVVQAIREELGVQGAASAMELLICNTLEAQGHKPIASADPNRLPETYDPAFIHADADLGELAAGLMRTRAGRLCLYGPPGTGKTAYGRWLAAQLGVPLHVKRASELMSKWVGDNEKNIARAFRQAEQDGAVLLIDEVDSFLQDRRDAQRSWEVSLVNEMLTQMESFSGVFVASTNLMDGLDQAALRRFDLKVKFEYLTPRQAWDLFCRHCDVLAPPAPSENLKSRLGRLQKLTPGDFAAVVCQHRFRTIGSPADFIAALEAECAVKEGTRSAVGFL